MKGWREEEKENLEKKPRWDENRTEYLTKKVPNEVPNRSKIAPKSSQNDAKGDKKSKQGLQGDLRALWRPIPPLWCHRYGPTWNPKSTQNREKTKSEIIKFSVAFLFQKYSKMDTKTTPKSSPIWSKMGPNSEPK